MKRVLLIAALAVVAAFPARAAGCADDPKASIKQVEQALTKQTANLSKEQSKAATSAIDRAKMANKFGNVDGACKSIEQAWAALGTKS